MLVGIASITVWCLLAIVLACSLLFFIAYPPEALAGLRLKSLVPLTLAVGIFGAGWGIFHQVRLLLGRPLCRYLLAGADRLLNENRIEEAVANYVKAQQINQELLVDASIRSHILEKLQEVNHRRADMTGHADAATYAETEPTIKPIEVDGPVRGEL